MVLSITYQGESKDGELMTWVLRTDTLFIVVCNLRIYLVYVTRPLVTGSGRSLTVIGHDINLVVFRYGDKMDCRRSPTTPCVWSLQTLGPG